MMQTSSVVALTGQATFGRDAAMFERLLGFVAELSVVLWSLVALTLAIRFVGVLVYRRGAARTAPVEIEAPGGTVPTRAADTAFTELRRPAEAPAAGPAHEATPQRVPAFAGSSTGW
ncbi:hypothetical protein MRU69_05610 [Kocuria flava]|uniref:hypothetical protein n=1 Tax=Kocuria flava TaxID=446860 RepID=UPI001FF2E7BB|nr:hypothetical protein [Kocuria flava]MCJ8504329.1 hypothetical protein [Kocuria flava]MCJ8504344.1 hypothetical protein [Kocuria flava]